MRLKLKELLEVEGDMKFSMASDVAELWLAGKAGAYRLDLDLPWDKIRGLVQHARSRLQEHPDM